MDKKTKKKYNLHYKIRKKDIKIKPNHKLILIHISKAGKQKGTLKKHIDCLIKDYNYVIQTYF